MTAATAASEALLTLLHARIEATEAWTRCMLLPASALGKAASEAENAAGSKPTRHDATNDMTAAASGSATAGAGATTGAVAGTNGLLQQVALSAMGRVAAQAAAADNLRQLMRPAPTASAADAPLFIATYRDGARDALAPLEALLDRVEQAAGAAASAFGGVAEPGSNRLPQPGLELKTPGDAQSH